MAALAVSEENTKASKPVSRHSERNPNNWENWEHLKLSSYHGRKLTRRNYKPYHPTVDEKNFFLHELDQLDFGPEEKYFIVMRTFRKLFGSVVGANSSKGRKFNAKLSFLREKGKNHFASGKKVTELISLPDSYWEGYKETMESKKDPKEGKDTAPKRPRLELNDKNVSTKGVQTRHKRTVQ